MHGQSAGCLAAIMALFLISACGKGDDEAAAKKPADEPGDKADAGPNDAEFWIPKLLDATRVQEATTHLTRIANPIAIVPLGTAWRQRSKPIQLLKAVIDIADKNSSWPEAVPFLVEGVEAFFDDTNSAEGIESATLAVDALARAKKHAPVEASILLKAATMRLPARAVGQKVRLAATRALGAFGDDPRVVDSLIVILNTDLEDQHITLFAAAADALAKIRNPKSIQPLILALYRVPPAYQFCRRGLVAIGPPAIPDLLRVMTRKDPTMNAFAKKHKFATDCKKRVGPGSKCRAPTNLEFKAAVLLGDLHAVEAVPHLVAGLKQEPLPAFFERTGRPGPTQHQAYLDALKKIGDSSAAEPVLAYAFAKDTDEDLQAMAVDTYSYLTRATAALPQLAERFQDEDGAPQLRSAAAMAYGRLAREELQLAPLAKAAEGLQKKVAKWRHLASKATGADRTIAEANFEDYQMFQRAFLEHLARAATGVACQDDPSCYLGYLDRDAEAIAQSMVRWIPDVASWEHKDQDGLRIGACERALIELAKLGPKAQGTTDTLLAHLPTTERITRQGVLLALSHVAPRPCTKCVAALDQVIESQKGQATLSALTAEARVWRYYFQWAK